MSKKAKHCDECRYFLHCCATLRGNPPPPCLKGHRPRFYSIKSVTSNDWGYKRKCDDFAEKQ